MVRGVVVHLLAIAAWLHGGIFGAVVVQETVEPVRLIYDTDMGNDIDDAMALAVIHALQSRGECRLLAVTVSKDNFYAAAYCDLLNHLYGRPGIPIGIVRNGPTPEDGRYVRQVCEARDQGRLRYARSLKRPGDVEEAIPLLRRTLAGQPDHSVTVVQVGFSTNLARLLDSPPDRYSPLQGKDLASRKIRLLSMVAGSFGQPGPKGGREYNIYKDLPSARKLFGAWPTPIVVSGYEIGKSILYPGERMRRNEDSAARHPLRESYRLYVPSLHDRPTWDLTSVLYSVRPHRDDFLLSSPGEVILDPEGRTRLERGGHGRHRHLKIDTRQVPRIRDLLVDLVAVTP
jgi:inosine-uridine nucleoside N-ribohydrolase